MSEELIKYEIKLKTIMNIVHLFNSLNSIFCCMNELLYHKPYWYSSFSIFLHSSVKMGRLKQAKDEADREATLYRSHMEAEYQKTISEVYNWCSHFYYYHNDCNNCHQFIIFIKLSSALLSIYASQKFLYRRNKSCSFIL